MTPVHRYQAGRVATACSTCMHLQWCTGCFPPAACSPCMQAITAGSSCVDMLPCLLECPLPCLQVWLPTFTSSSRSGMIGQVGTKAAAVLGSAADAAPQWGPIGRKASISLSSSGLHCWRTGTLLCLLQCTPNIEYACFAADAHTH